MKSPALPWIFPKNTHRRFKIACTVAGTQMNSEIRQFIERRSRELEASTR